jgi:hypothetical protein
MSGPRAPHWLRHKPQRTPLKFEGPVMHAPVVVDGDVNAEWPTIHGDFIGGAYRNLVTLVAGIAHGRQIARTMRVAGISDLFRIGGERLPNLIGLCSSNKI